MARRSGRDTTPGSVRRTLEPFKPSDYGFEFVNSFHQLPNLPDLPGNIDNGIEAINVGYGLCGGMALAARDFFLYNRTIPANTQTPQSGPLFNCLWHRQLDTFDRASGYKLLRRFVHFYLPTTYTRELSVDEVRKMKRELDRGLPVVIGLVYVRAGRGNIWDNHQVLAYDYQEPGGNKTVISVYDPNEPDANNIEVHAEIEEGHGFLRPNQDWMKDAAQYQGSNKMEDIVGLILMDVPPQEPPRNL